MQSQSSPARYHVSFSWFLALAFTISLPSLAQSSRHFSQGSIFR